MPAWPAWRWWCSFACCFGLPHARRWGRPSLAPPSAPRSRRGAASLLDFQDREKRLLGNFDLAQALHPLLAFLLLFEQLAFAGDVAAVALGQHVLAQRAHGLARDHLAADGGLDGHLEHLPRDELLHLRRQRPAALVGSGLVDDERERVHRLAGDHDVELDQIRGPVAAEVVVERRIAAGDGLEAI